MRQLAALPCLLPVLVVLLQPDEPDDQRPAKGADIVGNELNSRDLLNLQLGLSLSNLVEPAQEMTIIVLRPTEKVWRIPARIQFSTYSYRFRLQRLYALL